MLKAVLLSFFPGITTSIMPVRSSLVNNNNSAVQNNSGQILHSQIQSSSSFTMFLSSAEGCSRSCRLVFQWNKRSDAATLLSVRRGQAYQPHFEDQPRSGRPAKADGNTTAHCSGSIATKMPNAVAVARTWHDHPRQYLTCFRHCGSYSKTVLSPTRLPTLWYPTRLPTLWYTLQPMQAFLDWPAFSSDMSLIQKGLNGWQVAVPWPLTSQLFWACITCSAGSISVGAWVEAGVLHTCMPCIAAGTMTKSLVGVHNAFALYAQMP